MSTILEKLQVRTRWTQLAAMEMTAMNLQLIGEASGGAITFTQENKVGHFDERIDFKHLDDFVQERDILGTSAVDTQELERQSHNSVRVGARTNILKYRKTDFDYIGLNFDPKNITDDLRTSMMSDATAISKQQTQDVLNRALISLIAASLNDDDVILSDISVNTPDGEPENSATLNEYFLIDTPFLLNESGDDIAMWLGNPQALRSYFTGRAANETGIHDFGSLKIKTDSWGRRFLMSSITPLVIAGSPTKYYTLGMRPNSVNITYVPNSFWSSTLEVIGQENLYVQGFAQWDYFIDIPAYSWNTESGGISPNKAALGSSANWTRLPTFDDNLPVVILKSK